MDKIKKYVQSEEHESLQENYLRILALKDNFESLYDVDLETDEYVVYVKSQSYLENVNSRMINRKEFFADTYTNVDVVVYPEDRQRFKDALNKEYIKKF